MTNVQTDNARNCFNCCKLFHHNQTMLSHVTCVVYPCCRIKAAKPLIVNNLEQQSYIIFNMDLILASGSYLPCAASCHIIKNLQDTLTYEHWTWLKPFDRQMKKEARVEELLYLVAFNAWPYSVMALKSVKFHWICIKMVVSGCEPDPCDHFVTMNLEPYVVKDPWPYLAWH